jgi:SAM-dependent methyltransferase
MTIQLINPKNNLPLILEGDKLSDGLEDCYIVVNQIPRFSGDNYANNFGFQWNKFIAVQLDATHKVLNSNRFFAQTAWEKSKLTNENILEVGSGAGRFSRVVLEETKAVLWSVDYSNAVDANLANNKSIAPERLKLFQASIYALPFLNNTFDKVFCFGVLQHTPSFEDSIKALISKVKPGGEIVVDFYPIKSIWTKVHSKYLLRPITKKMSNERLLLLIRDNIDWLMKTFDFLSRNGGYVLTRFLPITDISHFPKTLSSSERRELAVLDTFDAFSPEYDNPQRVGAVVKMFEGNGARVTFAGIVKFDGNLAMVVRAVKQAEEAIEIS